MAGQHDSWNINIASQASGSGQGASSGTGTSTGTGTNTQQAIETIQVNDAHTLVDAVVKATQEYSSKHPYQNFDVVSAARSDQSGQMNQQFSQSGKQSGSSAQNM